MSVLRTPPIDMSWYERLSQAQVGSQAQEGSPAQGETISTRELPAPLAAGDRELRKYLIGRAHLMQAAARGQSDDVDDVDETIARAIRDASGRPEVHREALSEIRRPGSVSSPARDRARRLS